MNGAATARDMVLSPQGIRFAGCLWPCTIGRGGLRADKREGDGATPRGVHRLVAVLYRPDRMARPCDWAQPIRPGDVWSDDPGHGDYNHLVRAPYGHSHEAMRRADPLYDLVVVSDWNWPEAKPGAGSAIFLHRWRRPGFPTEGCIAFHPAHLLQLVAQMRPTTRLIVPG